MNRFARIALSAFVIFHVAAIFILPNPTSILFRETRSVVSTYATALGIQTTWRFFSPNPLLKILEYDIYDADGRQKGQFRFPQSIEQSGTREAYNRIMNYAMYMASNKEYLEKYLHAYICKMHPEARTIEYWVVGRVFPDIEQAQRQGLDRDSMLKTDRTGIAELECAHIEKAEVSK